MMAIRTILVPLSGGVGSEAALDAALLIGRRAGAHVEVLHVSPDPGDMVPPMGNGATAPIVGELLEKAERDARVGAERARAVFDARMAGGSVPRVDGPPSAAERRLTVGWREAVGPEDREVARRGRLFDLIVVGRPGRHDELSSETTLETALLQSGRPVLVVPPAATTTIGARIAIAWNDSTAAARALASAGPFLAEAEGVVVLEGDAAADGGSAETLAGMLAWHGVPAALRRFRSGDASIGAALLAAAAEEGADLLVMGGYGHSRLREMIFGGATIDTIFESHIPLLMTH